MYPSFFKPQVTLNLIIDNAYLGVVAVGMTFVILSGGIDLSVGSIVGCTTIVVATLVENRHMHPVVAIVIVLAGGVIVGGLMGSLIHFFELPPFLVTLGGLFFFRGLALYISRESIGINHPAYDWLSSFEITMGGTMALPLSAIVFLVVLAIAIYISFFTRFGRNVYAIGGNESSALLMGLPVGRTKIGIYALSGLCSALGGVLLTMFKLSGDATSAVALELDAIAAVVVGGTLLTGGVGYVAGTFLGILIFGIIQTAITFDGRLSSWWTKIVVGLLLLAFILLQKLLQFGKGSND
jgi:galactofuranose transport system permease protein